MKVFYRQLIICFVVILIGRSVTIVAASGPESVPIILKDDITVSFYLSLTAQKEDYSAQLINIACERSVVLQVMLDSDKKAGYTLYFISKQGVIKHSPGITVPGEQVRVNAKISYSPDIFKFNFGDTVFEISEPGFLKDQKYSVLVLPDRATNYDRSGQEYLRINSVDIYSGQVVNRKHTEIYLLLLLVLADILFFLVIHFRNKYLKRKRKLEQNLAITIKNEKIVEKAHQKISAVNLFGGFAIFDSKGEEVSKSFSPMLKELFLLLTCKYHVDGISSVGLKDILWFDKSEYSARNNRSVYLAKLRQILNSIGKYDISNRSGRWIISFENIYVDYFHYFKIVNQKTITNEDVNDLISIVKKGPFLPDCNYVWLDEIKAEIADFVITILTDFSEQVNHVQNPELINSVADALFIVDPLNEQALIYKCRYYLIVGKAYLAKQLFSTYSKEYKSIYDEEYSKTYSDIVVEQL